jgi:hypothetical protein
MGINKRHLKAVVIVVLILAVAYCLLSVVTFYSIDTYIDINTGDIKEIRKVCHIKIREEIKQTEFSNLVRKFISVQKEPEWKHCYGSFRDIFTNKGASDSHKWGGFPSKCKAFTDIVEPNHISESELREILQGCLSDMEKGDRASFDNRLDAYMKRNN